MINKFTKTMLTLVVVLTLLLMSDWALADNDGILIAAWDAPVVGNVPTGYELSYTVNGVDSLTKEVQGLIDTSIILDNVGDWALLSIRAYFDYWSEFQQDSIRVYSDSVVSDIVVFSQAVSVGPPSGIRWEE